MPTLLQMIHKSYIDEDIAANRTTYNRSLDFVKRLGPEQKITNAPLTDQILYTFDALMGAFTQSLQSIVYDGSKAELKRYPNFIIKTHNIFENYNKLVSYLTNIMKQGKMTASDVIKIKSAFTKIMPLIITIYGFTIEEYYNDNGDVHKGLFLGHENEQIQDLVAHIYDITDPKSNELYRPTITPQTISRIRNRFQNQPPIPPIDDEGEGDENEGDEGDEGDNDDFEWNREEYENYNNDPEEGDEGDNKEDNDENKHDNYNYLGDLFKNNNLSNISKILKGNIKRHQIGIKQANKNELKDQNKLTRVLRNHGGVPHRDLRRIRGSQQPVPPLSIMDQMQQLRNIRRATRQPPLRQPPMPQPPRRPLIEDYDENPPYFNPYNNGE